MQGSEFTRVVVLVAFFWGGGGVRDLELFKV